MSQQIESFQDWLSILKIKDNKIFLTSGKVVQVLKVTPINFKLKSQLEQKAILNQYKLFLKNLNSNVQIIISSKRTDISYHIDEILKSTNENPKIKEICEDYLLFLKQMISEKGSITKEFFLVLDDEPNVENEIIKIKEILQGCGNEVDKCCEKDLDMLIKNSINNRLYNLV